MCLSKQIWVTDNGATYITILKGSYENNSCMMVGCTQRKDINLVEVHIFVSSVH